MAAGRPRSFDPEQALEKALHVFWKKGYEGASMPDLTEAMGINRPSLYAAFGNKEELFRKALDKYCERGKAIYEEALNGPTARESIIRLLRATADAMSDPQNPRGCLMMQGTLTCGDEAKAAIKDIQARQQAKEDMLRKRFERAEAEGETLCCTPPDMARYITTLMQGIAMQAASGATREQLHGIVDATLKRWEEEEEEEDA